MNKVQIDQLRVYLNDGTGRSLYMQLAASVRPDGRRWDTRVGRDPQIDAQYPTPAEQAIADSVAGLISQVTELSQTKKVLILRCEKDDNTDSDHHLTVMVRLPLPLDAVGDVLIRNAKCVCGAHMLMPGIRGFEIADLG